MTEQELMKLIDALLDGDISEADFLRLEAELSVDSKARKAYYDRTALTMLLEDSAAEVQGENVSTTKRRSSKRPESAWRKAFAAMAIVCALLFGLTVWLIGSSLLDDAGNKLVENENGTSPRIEDKEDQATGFAVVMAQSDAVWGAGQSLHDGSLVPLGEIQLEQGVVQLELFSGVMVIVEGKARFSIESPMEMTVAEGQVRAQVPEPAQGFRVRTSGGEVVDLGTEFAIHAGPDSSEVHVLEGEIEWRPKTNVVRKLHEGEALRLIDDGDEQTIPANRSQFIGAAELYESLNAEKITKRARWNTYRKKLQEDERVVAWYSMDTPRSSRRRIANQAERGSMRAGEGAVVAASPAQDRWGTEGAALDFSPTGSRVRLNISGELRSMTLSTWVRINSLDRWYNSLFLTDGHELNEPHWQIMDDGRLFFSVKKRDEFDRSRGERDKHIYYSPPFWNSSMSGQWLMLTTVYDVDAMKVTHYLNGDVISQERIPEEYVVEAVRIGNASLCNWGLPTREDPHFAVRNLNGSMDEFVIFSAALSALEVKDLYENGRP
ncbi:FecR protein [Thalassoglobus neptunius]|uniref:FecR protein n=1 Tax=Thalassoglobus neptunius TaxID=1938619 RepID=A0A5C5WJM0_9PLAN|nr:LamG-like jellyroll fold domain-containing protein [Thalassoglobus neptunius]TWT50042.1 FecR protein [Thalassoglobus neptunius]